MKRRLFLTGDMGVGKSTAIAAALGDKLPSMGGFLTRRNRDAQGNVSSFSLMKPDGSAEEVFLDLTSGKPQVHLEVFETLAVSCLRGDVLVLDEIGGIELLSPAFVAALEHVLHSGVPVLGVVKGPGPAGALIKKLQLEDAYTRQLTRLWDTLSRDENTRIHTCEKFDETAQNLAAQWVREYCL